MRREGPSPASAICVRRPPALRKRWPTPSTSGIGRSTARESKRGENGSARPHPRVKARLRSGAVTSVRVGGQAAAQEPEGAPVRRARSPAGCPGGSRRLAANGPRGPGAAAGEAGCAPHHSRLPRLPGSEGREEDRRRGVRGRGDGPARGAGVRANRVAARQAPAPVRYRGAFGRDGGATAPGGGAPGGGGLLRTREAGLLAPPDSGEGEGGGARKPEAGSGDEGTASATRTHVPVLPSESFGALQVPPEAHGCRVRTDG